MFSVARGLAVMIAERQLIAFQGDSRPGWVDVLDQVHPERGWFNPGFWGFIGLAIAFHEPGNLVPAFVLIALGAGFFVSATLSMKMSKQLSSDLTQPQS